MNAMAQRMNPGRMSPLMWALAAVLVVSLAVATPSRAYAWGPEDRETFTMEVPATYNTFDSITNNPDLGDERNFVRVATVGEKGWSDVATMEPGHTYFARMYVNNDAADNLGLTATNVRAAINLPTKDDTWGTSFEVNGFLSSDNSTPNEIWDNIVLKSDSPFHVRVLSAKYYNNISTEADEGFDLGTELYNDEEGALLGYEQMDGNVPGQMAASGYVLVRFEPVFQGQNSDVSVPVTRDSSTVTRDLLIATGVLAAVVFVRHLARS